jgi:uncharacterized protein YbaP (TraB family)
MDVALTRTARSLGLPVDALEEHEDQLRALVAAVSVADLVDTIAARKQLRCEIVRNRAAYRAGDRLVVERVYGADRSGLLLAPRNRRWLPRLEMYLRGVFVAVGVGHLVGPNSLLVMLAGAGYAVAPHDAPR